MLIKDGQWSPMDIAYMKNLYQTGQPIEQIAKALGRQKASVVHMLKRLRQRHKDATGNWWHEDDQKVLEANASLSGRQLRDRYMPFHAASTIAENRHKTFNSK